MSREIRSRRAGPAHDRPLYARVLRLRHLAPSGLLCFVFLEGSVALAVLLALAELVTWWGVLVLPVTVALMVKLNDLLAGQLARTEPEPIQADLALARPALRPATVTVRTRIDLSTYPTAEPIDAGVLNGPPASRRWGEELDVQEQRVRQAVARRFD